MKTDTLTGPNLSYRVAVLDGEQTVKIDGDCCLYLNDDDCYYRFDYADPATFQPIAERELISVISKTYPGGEHYWDASCFNKAQRENSRYQPIVKATGSTMAEAMMRCYVKSYLGDNTKGE